MVDIIPVPYSESVIESYRNLVTDVQTFIQHMVDNHLDSLSRKTEGVIPTGQIIDALNYSQDSILTDQELSEVASCIIQFNKTWPLHAHNPFFKLEITNLNRDDVGWYIELDALLEGSKRKQELQDLLNGDKENKKRL